MNETNKTGQTLATRLPKNFDSSFNLLLTLFFVCQDAGAGNLVFGANYCCTSTGSVLGVPSGTPTATARTTGNQVFAAPTSAGGKGNATLSLDLRSFDANSNTLWITAYRDGTSVSDTKTGSVYVYAWQLLYRQWCVNGYVS
jgi:hypothetical protein